MNLSSPKDFIARVLAAAQTRPDPFLAPMVRELAERSEIIFSSEVESIRITSSEPKHLVRLNPDFIEKYAATDDDLLFILLHEMVHRLHPNDPDRLRYPAGMSGDDMVRACHIYESILSPLDLQAASLIEDIMVNARLCARWFPHGAPLLLKLHDLSRFPDVLMVPPVLLDLYRGRVLELNPLYESPHFQADYSPNTMPAPEFHSRIVPVIIRVKDLPVLEEKDDHKDFWLRDDNFYNDHFWVKGLLCWYWKAWSNDCKCSLATLYEILRNVIIGSCSVHFVEIENADNGSRASS